MVAMEECRHEAAALFALVGDALHHIRRYVGRQKRQQDQFVAMVVPEGRVGVVAEIRRDDLAADVGVLPVAVAAETWSQETAVERGIEEVALTGGAAFDLNPAQERLPGRIRLAGYLFEGLARDFSFKGSLGIFHAYE